MTIATRIGAPDLAGGLAAQAAQAEGILIG